MLVFLTMLAMGALIGFVGAGGAGVVIAVLTLVFNVPIHTAVGTSLAAMIFTTVSGAFSHFREGNLNVKVGAAVGIAGAAGAFLGSKISTLFPAAELKYCTASMLIASAVLVYTRLSYPNLPLFHTKEGQKPVTEGARFWILAVLAGIGNGLLSGTFGFGAAQFIQLSLLIFFAMPLFQSVGTTMLIILPIAAFGGFGYLLSGYLDFMLFIQVLLGLMIGAYTGAKFTRLAPRWFLKWMMVLLPGVAGVLMIVVKR
ncbi:sulfite exporter TauE/SafE family protein [Oxalobacter paraformigenes]|uniref:Probable membrane transporter protein n=1 Tax=Oxalobacter paraformigenes TaxID=556268 RepID=C3X304_9BURK|nr:sulfite exporter TauE/SafE family protein [Oxalobacter paraformigenes]EEO27590.2 hypothetical protein OFAG_00743 [Oxalobacter paraformigenes]